MEADHPPLRPTTSRVGGSPVVGVLVVQDELSYVLDDAFGALEQTQRPTVLGVVGDCEVAASYFPRINGWR
jgi:hypothetical protein